MQKAINRALRKSERSLCLRLPVIDYSIALDLQHRLVEARHSGIIDKDVILILEHPDVFTLGRRGGLENLTVSETFLKRLEIRVIQTKRGGNITFHGPGQLICYPVIDLKAAGFKVVDFVEGLEEIMLQLAADWGIDARRNQKNRGVWIGNSKLGSIGIAIRRGISFHGFAFNVNMSLLPFNWINPCGIKDIGITTMERELGQKVPMHEVAEHLNKHIRAVFNLDLVMTSLPSLLNLLTVYPKVDGHSSTENIFPGALNDYRSSERD